MNEQFENSLRRVLHGSFNKLPEEMLEDCMNICIELSGASGGSIFGEEGPYLQFLFSNVQALIGVKVPWTSIAGTTAQQSVVIYTYAPADKRHYTGVDANLARQTRYLLSIPIPSIHVSKVTGQAKVKAAGVLQLLFDSSIFPTLDVSTGAKEFSLDSLKEQHLDEGKLEEVLLILPNISFGLEVLRLRTTSYQVIHELKNKLIAAQSWMNCLKEDVEGVAPKAFDNEGIAEDFQLAESAAREGANIAKSYLQFTKIYTPKYKEVDVAQVLQQTTADLRVLSTELAGGAVQVRTEVPVPIPPKTLDPEQIRMALFNLGKNAVEALGEHKVQNAEVCLGAEATDGTLRLTVKDNGPGMPEEIATNLFVPFKTKKEGGTGLGLTITKKIVDVHGGRIWCDTGPSGTRFTIEI